MVQGIGCRVTRASCKHTKNTNIIRCRDDLGAQLIDDGIPRKKSIAPLHSIFKMIRQGTQRPYPVCDVSKTTALAFLWVASVSCGDELCLG